MEITKIRIKNFKSIKDEISLEIKKIAGKSCCILLGINESGKSNILEAISFLNNNEEKINYEIFCNKQAQDNIENISIIYEQQCDKNDDFKKELITQGLDRKLANTIKIEMIEREFIVDSCGIKKDTCSIIYGADEEELQNYIVNDKNTKIEARTGENFIMNERGKSNILDKDKLGQFMKITAIDIISSHFPEIHFWKSYEEKYLINKGIDLNSFMDNPDMSIPLRNCFRIAGIKDIKESITSAMSNPAQTSKLCKLLSKKVTEHINETWGEHSTNIQFQPLNGKLYFLIEERDRNNESYNFNQRSDGFKHYISFLLNLSAENKTGQLKNNIILLDEPEMHLHPSAQKYFRDELLQIAKNNLVIFATHSIYMVDHKNLDRHISIKKSREATYLSSIEKDNLYGEEVLYTSLGTSVFEHIESNILILEGKTDRDIFKLYKSEFHDEITSPNISLFPADGCTNIKFYAKLINKKLINGFVLTDSDKSGQRAKNEILDNAEGYNEMNVFEIDDFLDVSSKSTLEDLFDPKLIIAAVKEIYSSEIALDDSKPFLSQIKRKLDKGKYNALSGKLKKAIFNKISELSKTKLKQQKYFEFFKKLQKKLNDAPAN